MINYEYIRGKAGNSPFEVQFRVGDVRLVDGPCPVELHRSDNYLGLRQIEMPVEVMRSLGPWFIFQGDVTWRVYQDFDQVSAIHRRFAQLSDEPTAILQFAKKFGLLGTGAYTYSDEDRPPYWYSLQSCRDWQDAIHHTQIAVEALDLLRSYGESLDSGHLADFSRFVQAKRERMASALHRSEMIHHDVWVKAEYWKHVLMQKDQHPFLLLREFVAGLSSDYLRTWCRPSMDANRLKINLKSEMLIGAVAAAYANEVAGDTGLPRKCQGCGQWFMADHGKQRHCSDYCKTKAYRRRQQAKKEGNNA